MNLKDKARFLRYKRISNLAKGKILNLGSHDGELDKYLRKEHKNVSSADLGKADFIQDLNEKNWKSIKGKFDTLIAGEIIEHLENPIQFLKNCHRLLNEEGRLILTTPNATGLVYLKNPGWCVGYTGKDLTFEQDHTHIHTFTTKMLELLFRRTGFKNIKYQYLNGFIYNPIAYFVCNIIKRLRSDILIWGER